MKGFTYTPDDFDKDGVLKVSPLLWLVIIYLARHFLTLMFGGFSIFMGSRRGVDTSGLSVLFSEPAFVFASVPAFLVIAAQFRRVSVAGPIPRWIWRNAPRLLMGAALLDIGIIIGHGVFATLAINEWLIASIFVDAYVITYLLRSTRVRDTFAEFPDAKS